MYLRSANLWDGRHFDSGSWSGKRHTRRESGLLLNQWDTSVTVLAWMAGATI